MANNYFQFKQFRINQEGAAMKVGTDGVLLGAWTRVQNNYQRILDVGTGSGLIAIMLAQRTSLSTAQVDAVEIDTKSYQQAVDNFENCNWDSRLTAYHCSFQEFCKTAVPGYDLIVSNPPYFRNGVKAQGKSRTQARHAKHLPFEDLLSGVKNLLNHSGSLSVILPVSEAEYFEHLAHLNEFWLRRKTAVHPNPGKPAKRYLLEFVLSKTNTEFSGLLVENGKRHVYSPEYIKLTKDFYLHLDKRIT